MWTVVVLAANALLLYVVLNGVIYGWKWLQVYGMALRASLRAALRREWLTARYFVLYGYPKDGMQEGFAELTIRVSALLGVAVCFTALLYPDAAPALQAVFLPGIIGLITFIGLQILKRCERLRRLILDPCGQNLSCFVCVFAFVDYLIWGNIFDSETSLPFWLVGVIFAAGVALAAVVTVASATLFEKCRDDFTSH